MLALACILMVGIVPKFNKHVATHPKLIIWVRLCRLSTDRNFLYLSEWSSIYFQLKERFHCIIFNSNTFLKKGGGSNVVVVVFFFFFFFFFFTFSLLFLLLLLFLFFVVFCFVFCMTVDPLDGMCSRLFLASYIIFKFV